jgi:hypothetical protein
MSIQVSAAMPDITPVWVVRYFKDEKSAEPIRTVFYSCDDGEWVAAEASKFMAQHEATRIELCRAVLKNPPPYMEKRFVD